MNEEILSAIFRGAWTLPYLCIWIAGLIICFNHHKKNSLAANLAIAGFSIFIIGSILSFAMQTWAMIDAAQNGYSSMQTIFTAIGIVSASLNIIAWILLLVALVHLFKNQQN